MGQLCYTFSMDHLTSAPARTQERITDAYLAVMLFAFPLFPGFEGYVNITLSKYLFLLAATGLWLAALLITALRTRSIHSASPGLAQFAALSFLGVSILSWLRSPWRAESLIGMGRYDGLLITLCYVLIFLGVSLFTRPKLLHAGAFAAGIGLCNIIGVLQLFGLDFLKFFPADYSYYDMGTLYSGAYLGTIGNTNILDAALCTALPLFAGLYICGCRNSPLFLLPLMPGCFVLARAGGSGAVLAFAVCALAAAPLLLTDLSRLRRGLRCAALILASVAVALAYQPDYVNRVLTARFSLSPAVIVTGAAACVLLTLSMLKLRGFFPSKRALRRAFLALDASLAVAGLLLVYFGPWENGTLYELSRALHGELSDEFGSSRLLIWRETVALVRERPLLGGGPGTLAARLEIEFSRYVPETGATLTSFVDNAHNIYLGYLVNCGALGLLSYLALLFAAARTAFKTRRAPMTAALLLGALCAAVHGLFGLGLCLSEPFFWIVLGLICSQKEVRSLCMA